MDWQLVPVLVMVGAAAAYLGRATWRSWKSGKSGCGGGCGCASKSTQAAARSSEMKLISSEQLTTRLRQPDHS